MPGKYVLYEHRNKTNGKRYIGISCNYKQRWNSNGKRYRNSTYFWRAINKYGWENFTHKILIKDLSREEASELEKAYIKKYKTQNEKYGYNLTAGGTNAPPMLGRKHSEATKQKMREAALGRVVSKEQRRKQSEKMKGLLVGKLNPKSRAVRCLNTGEVFETQHEAARATGCLQSKISLCCNGFQKQTHGYRWEHVDEEDN